MNDGAVVYVALRAVTGSGLPTSTIRKRRVNDWIPHSSESMVDEDGMANESHYRYFQEIGRRMGGINGPTLTEIQSANTQSAAHITALLGTVTSLAQQAASNAATIEALRASAIAAGAPGAANIPAPNTTYVDSTPPVYLSGGSGGGDGGGD